MDINILLIVFLISVSFLAGWFSAIFRISRDENIVKLQPDEAVCKKPPENHILVAVGPDVARRLVYDQEKQYDQTEMRNLRRNM